MSKSQNQKLKILYLMKIMLDMTDDEHVLTISEIIAELAKHDITCERKSLYSDIDLLRSYGIDIETTKGKTFTYYIANREFELPELRLLVDAVQSSKFITQKKSYELIRKIEGLTSKHMGQQLQREVFVANRIKTMNESIYYNIDKIHTAIAENKQIAFNYYEWIINGGRIEKHGRREGEKYILSPWALSWDDENYYVIAYYEKYRGISNFRVDKMEHIELLEVNRDGDNLFKQFDMGIYCTKLFRMFEGREEIIKLLFSNSLINVIVDRFGKDVDIEIKDSEHFILTIKVAVSPTFLGWLATFGKDVKILSPQNVITEFKNHLSTALNLY